jgi:amidase
MSRVYINLVATLIMAVPAAGAGEPMCFENATIGDLQEALAAGRTTSTALVRAYLARIEAYDRGGSCLNAVREVNPE